jgi:hypothetical protein
MELTEDLKELFTRIWQYASYLHGRCSRETRYGMAAQGRGRIGVESRDDSERAARIKKRIFAHGQFSARGRKSTEEHPPNLLDDIRAITDSQSQTDPTFETTQLYTRLTAAEMREQLVL